MVRAFMEKVAPRASRRLFVQSFALIEREIAGQCESLLDVGCGRASPVGVIARSVPRRVGVDRHGPYLEESRRAGIHTEYRQMDVMEIAAEFGPASFDCVVALDLIEHLPKDAGLRLIEQMERVARRKVIIFTPNGFLPQTAYDDNALQEHLSGWDAAEMRAKGYRVRGVNGWRPLRGERGLIRHRPEWLWRKVSLATQPLAEAVPEQAFQLLCVKEVGA